MLVSVAVGGLFGYSGQRILVEGDTFVNTLVGYDQFTPGHQLPEQPAPALLGRSWTSSEITFDRESQGKFGQPIDFTADVTTKETPDAPAKKEVLKVNDPLSASAAPASTSPATATPPWSPSATAPATSPCRVPWSPSSRARTTTRRVVIKVPDAKPEQLAFAGFFLPTAFVTDKGVSFSGDPELINPQLSLNSYFGDLGLDDGAPQNVFELDVKKLTPLNARNLDTKGIVLAPGQHLHPAERQGLHQLRRREALRRRGHPPQPRPAATP